MANPISIICPENIWKKVATNVTIGQVKKLSSLPSKYLEIYKMTGQSAPSGKSKGAPIFLQNNYEGISSSSAIDVYIMAIGGNGKVRIDLP